MKKLWYWAAALSLALSAMSCDDSDKNTETEQDDSENNSGKNNSGNQNNNNGQNNNGGQNNNQNQGCGDVPDTGVCAGTVVKYCKDGQLGQYDCALENTTCGEMSDGTNSWYGCLKNGTSEGCGVIPDTGVCVGTVVKYCKDGQLGQYDCALEQTTCGEMSDGTKSWYGCLQNGSSEGCGDVPETGICAGTVVKYCKDGQLGQYDCALENTTCGEMSDGTKSWYGCLQNGSGDNPPSGNLNTAEDWARARIAGTVSTEDAFNAIAYHGGFPVITDDNTVIFMHWYEGGNWQVAGDFNNWAAQSMTSNGDIWYAEVPMPADAVNKNYYKFIKDGEQYIADPWSLRYTFTEDGEISYITKPNAAHLVRFHNFKSPQGLKPRTLRIYVPAGDGPFDVLYAHDAQNLFGTGDPTYGSWKVEDNMAKANASFIVAAMDNMGEERLSEYSFVDEDLSSVGYGNVTARGDEYAKFVHETVRPFIESKFNVTEKAGLMGSSMGGLISLYINHLYPNKYAAVLALSPTTAWGRFTHDNGTTIEDMYAADGKSNAVLYLDNGGYPPDGGVCPQTLGSFEAAGDEFNRDCYCYTQSFVNRMKSIGYVEDKDIFYYYDEGAKHNEAAWSNRLVKPLQIFMNAGK